MSLPSGTYTITNVSFNNRVALTEGDDGEYVTCKLPGPVGTGEKWRLTSYGGDRYTIENEDHKLHVVPQSNVTIGGSVCGVRVKTSVAWTIIELSCEEYGPDVYSIHADGPANIVWALDDGQPDTPISLRHLTKDRRNMWQICSYPPVARRFSPFETPGTDKSALELVSVDQTADPNYLAVRCDWKNLPAGRTLQFLEPLLLLYHSEVVAELMVSADGTFVTDSERISMDLRPRDTPAFQTLAGAILSEGDVQVYLRIRKYKFYHSSLPEGDPEREYVYRHTWHKELIFKGIHSLRECVNLSNLRLLGSSYDEKDINGPYIRATVDAQILSTCLLKCSANAVATVYYGTCKLGIANLKDFPVEPHFMTEMQLPIRLVVEAISMTVCTQLVNLPSFTIDTCIQGHGLNLITAVDVHVTPMIFLKRELSFEFTMQNPLDTTLELRSMQLQGQGKSPKTSDCWMTSGYFKTFQLACSEKTPLDVFVESADIVVDQYSLNGLTWNLRNVPFSLHLF
ncbi:hypothetical protein DAEQUDRAFT_764041 [Daedalea quercina L-15889]|uniref:Uncharacterized protein n=1 Tax=Daedalea quercina L-15889 TaxID=1314783 RepID=A0A165RSB6_9APHY|nr:hypothetical protein DAEQUDRAFT_764041 [Daedalea quercina L-15889]